MKAGIWAAAGAAIVVSATAGPAQAAVADRAAPKLPAKVLAGPGSASAGYTARVAVMTAGSRATFTNTDVAMHNVVSAAGLFSTTMTATGKTTAIVGVDRLAPGTYRFFCSPHPNMKGQLIVR